MTGIPTGGPISGACLNASFAAEEELFDKFGWFRLSQRFGLRGRRKQYIVLRRYEDDVVGISYWFCSKCLLEFISSVYKNVSFDDSTESHHCDGRVFGKFLDVWYLIGFGPTQFTFTMHSPNEVGVWTGDTSLKKKLRFPATHGFKRDILSALRRDLTGRASRMRQLSLSPSDAFLCYSYGCLGAPWPWALYCCYQKILAVFGVT